MTVSELIELLKQHPADQQVIVTSYEEGYDPVTDVREITIEKTADKKWWVGLYHEESQSKRKALLIFSAHLHKGLGK